MGEIKMYVCQKESIDRRDETNYVWGEERPKGNYKSVIICGEIYEVGYCVQCNLHSKESFIWKIIKLFQVADRKVCRIRRLLSELDLPQDLQGLEPPAVLKELFMASEGLGMQEDISLGEIARRYIIYCTFQDDDGLNPIPSNEQVENADYFFYRGYDSNNKEVVSLDAVVDELGAQYVYNKVWWLGENIARHSSSQISALRIHSQSPTSGSSAHQSAVKCIYSSVHEVLHACDLEVLPTSSKDSTKQKLKKRKSDNMALEQYKDEFHTPKKLKVERNTTLRFDHVIFAIPAPTMNNPIQIHDISSINAKSPTSMSTLIQNEEKSHFLITSSSPTALVDLEQVETKCKENAIRKRKGEKVPSESIVKKIVKPRQKSNASSRKKDFLKPKEKSKVPSIKEDSLKFEEQSDVLSIKKDLFKPEEKSNVLSRKEVSLKLKKRSNVSSKKEDSLKPKERSNTPFRNEDSSQPEEMSSTLLRNEDFLKREEKLDVPFIRKDSSKPKERLDVPSRKKDFLKLEAKLNVSSIREDSLKLEEKTNTPSRNEDSSKSKERSNASSRKKDSLKDSEKIDAPSKKEDPFKPKERSNAPSRRENSIKLQSNANEINNLTTSLDLKIVVTKDKERSIKKQRKTKEMPNEDVMTKKLKSKEKSREKPREKSNEELKKKDLKSKERPSTSSSKSSELQKKADENIIITTSCVATKVPSASTLLSKNVNNLTLEIPTINQSVMKIDKSIFSISSQTSKEVKIDVSSKVLKRGKDIVQTSSTSQQQSDSPSLDMFAKKDTNSTTKDPSYIQLNPYESPKPPLNKSLMDKDIDIIKVSKSSPILSPQENIHGQVFKPKFEDWNATIAHAIQHNRVLLLENVDSKLNSEDIAEALTQYMRTKCEVRIAPPVSFFYGTTTMLLKLSSSKKAHEFLTEVESKFLTMANRLVIATSFSYDEFKGPQILKYHGHLELTQARDHYIDDSKNTVATSHLAQGNTIEFAYGLQWRLLDEQHEVQWQMLQEVHSTMNEKVEKRSS